jgi:hypothetical protein
MAKKKSGNIMGKYSATNKEMDAAEWCVRNGIRISPLCLKYPCTEWIISINLGNKEHRSKEPLKAGVIWERMYEYYVYYYDKYKEKNVTF